MGGGKVLVSTLEGIWGSVTSDHISGSESNSSNVISIK